MTKCEHKDVDHLLAKSALGEGNPLITLGLLEQGLAIETRVGSVSDEVGSNSC